MKLELFQTSEILVSVRAQYKYGKNLNNADRSPKDPWGMCRMMHYERRN